MVDTLGNTPAYVSKNIGFTNVNQVRVNAMHLSHAFYMDCYLKSSTMSARLRNEALQPINDMTSVRFVFTKESLLSTHTCLKRIRSQEQELLTMRGEESLHNVFRLDVSITTMD